MWKGQVCCHQSLTFIIPLMIWQRAVTISCVGSETQVSLPSLCVFVLCGFRLTASLQVNQCLQLLWSLGWRINPPFRSFHDGRRLALEIRCLLRSFNVNTEHVVPITDSWTPQSKIQYQRCFLSENGWIWSGSAWVFHDCEELFISTLLNSPYMCITISAFPISRRVDKLLLFRITTVAVRPMSSAGRAFGENKVSVMEDDCIHVENDRFYGSLFSSEQLNPSFSPFTLSSALSSSFFSQDLGVWWRQIPAQRVHRGNTNPAKEAEAQPNQKLQQLPGETVTCKSTWIMSAFCFTPEPIIKADFEKAFTWTSTLHFLR